MNASTVVFTLARDPNSVDPFAYGEHNSHRPSGIRRAASGRLSQKVLERFDQSICDDNLQVDSFTPQDAATVPEFCGLGSEKRPHTEPRLDINPIVSPTELNILKKTNTANAGKEGEGRRLSTGFSFWWKNLLDPTRQDFLPATEESTSVHKSRKYSALRLIPGFQSQKSKHVDTEALDSPITNANAKRKSFAENLPKPNDSPQTKKCQGRVWKPRN